MNEWIELLVFKRYSIFEWIIQIYHPWLAKRREGRSQESQRPKGLQIEVGTQRAPRLLVPNNAFDKSLKESWLLKRLFEVRWPRSDLTLGNVRDIMTFRWNGDSHTFRLNLPQSHDLRGCSTYGFQIGKVQILISAVMPPKQSY